MDGSISAPAEGADSPANVRPKRSRTGCMTCRNRRRKCDEGKPVCQNCISKKFDCQYAAAFQILGKHNFTPEVKTDVQYASVRFAGDDSEAPVTQKGIQPGSSIENPSSDLSAQTQAANLPSRRTRPTVVETNVQTLPSHTPSPNSYEFALHGLLALGSSSTTNHGVDFAPASALSENQEVSTFDFAQNHDLVSSYDGNGLQTRPGVHRTIPEHQSTLSFGSVGLNTTGSSLDIQKLEGAKSYDHSHQTSSTDTTSSLRGSSTDAIAAGRRIELLKLYRYNVAPWLDICDADQHFGVELLISSSRVPSLRSCVMRVAAASSSIVSLDEYLNHDSSDSLDFANDEARSSSNVEAIEGVLNLLIDMVPNLAACWSGQETGDRRSYIMERLLLELEYSTMHACAYWLSVRLELSHALMGGARRIPLPLLSVQFKGSSIEDSIAQCAYDAIALCVDSAMFAQGDDDRWLQQRYGLNRVEVWKALVQTFAHWYMHRSQAFQPVVELYPKDGVLSEDDYPTIVFTSGAALLANQLYHTGMLLLLQNKPRFADKPSQNSSSMSTLWHAHRICGISIQNDRSGWWDPCLVASLMVAGRTATHTSQHNAIVQALQSVQQLTGWIVDPCVDQLKNEWRLADVW